MKFSEFERMQAIATKIKQEEDSQCVSCKKCNSQWFEQVTLSRFSLNHNLVLGQEVPTKPGSVGYKFLRCIVCGNIIEPVVQHYARDLASNDYDFLLDTIENKHDNREEIKEKEERQDAIESEEL